MSTEKTLKKTDNSFFSGNIFAFFFSYKGKIGRMQFLTGLILLTGFLYILYFLKPLNPFLILLLSVFFRFYCWMALIQKRCRSFGSSGTLYFIPVLTLIFLVEVTAGQDLEFSPVLKNVLYICVAMCVLVHLILLLRPSDKSVFTGEKKGEEIREDEEFYEIERLEKQETRTEEKEKIKTEEKAVKEVKNSFLFRWPLLSFIVFTVFMFVVLDKLGDFFPETNRPAFRLGLAIGTIERNKYFYSDFCRTQGYEMKYYPQAFAKKFEKEISIAEQDQLTLVNRSYLKGIYPVYHENIEDFYKYKRFEEDESVMLFMGEYFNNMRKGLILSKLADEKGVDAEDIPWKDEYFSKLSLKETCELFDENYEAYLSHDCFFRYILDYAKKYSPLQRMKFKREDYLNREWKNEK